MDSTKSFWAPLWEKVGKLPAPLFLVFLIVVSSGALLLGTAAGPSRIAPWALIAFFLIVVFTVALGISLYWADRRREAEENRRREAEKSQKEAEGVAKALGQVLKHSLPKAGENRDCWTRPMLQLPLGQTVVDNVFQVFDAALREASQALREVMPGAEISKVRANVFLPTCDGVRAGDVCNLIIPRDELAASQGLQRNMQKHDELAITFRPNQGATGRAFVERRAIGVLTQRAWLDEKDSSKRKEIDRWAYVRLHPDADLTPTGDGVFTESGKRGFEMTGFQNRRVADRTAWIISMPIFLKIDGTLEVVGVFNVDCLEYRVMPAQLRAIYYRVLPFAGVLSGVLGGLPADRVAIFRFRE